MPCCQDTEQPARAVLCGLGRALCKVGNTKPYHPSLLMSYRGVAGRDRIHSHEQRYWRQEPNPVRLSHDPEGRERSLDGALESVLYVPDARPGLVKAQTPPHEKGYTAI